MKYTFFLLSSLFATVTTTAQIDHAEFLEGPFSSPREITETCLLCHEGIDQDIMKTRHWNWLGDEFTSADGRTTRLGKKNLINNFCIAVPSNWPRCTSCHIGYGWEDESFDFADPLNIDCLICHDGTGTYRKTPTGAGMPDPEVDLVKVAQSVGRTGINNCSICHFNGGGGTGVKHGDMDASMLNPSPELDVHMGGLGFTCSDCHAGENHMILGASHGSMAAGTNHIACTDCHTEAPHRRKLINDHSASVACETCHIPTFAREEPTKTWWDWSTAGQNKRVETDEWGLPLYDKMKGEFRWDKNIIPEYSWYNGKASYYLPGDKIPSGAPLDLNKPLGDINDATARITPFKVMKGRQVYDLKNNYLIVAKLFGRGGYWTTYDWDSASRLGMEAVNLAYSGRFAFVETRMSWPINHMVAPAKDALRCTDCHSRRGESRINWESLGYKGDPMSHGGRF
ncbi:MAG: tetrathionate reductase family octaheme c-type cytochrome [Bacteroidales bacterium]|nr:tetrathionate reductase family octaheme c-type cytochrome [Bacteroidales bacterium]